LLNFNYETINTNLLGKQVWKLSPNNWQFFRHSIRQTDPTAVAFVPQMTKPFGGTTKEGQLWYELLINQIVTIVITTKQNKKDF
jgi:hypothetical protein